MEWFTTTWKVNCFHLDLCSTWNHMLSCLEVVTGCTDICNKRGSHPTKFWYMTILIKKANRDAWKLEYRRAVIINKKNKKKKGKMEWFMSKSFLKWEWEYFPVLNNIIIRSYFISSFTDTYLNYWCRWITSSRL